MPEPLTTTETQHVAQDVSAVLNTVNTLRNGSMVFLLVLAVLALAAYRMWNKQKLAIESKKEKRAAAYTGALEKMQSSMSESSLLLRQLVQNSKGSMNAEDSLRLVEDRFDTIVRTEIVRIATVSIERNHFDTDPGTVEVVAVEAFARVLHMVLKDLKQYTMAINPEAFFLTTDKSFDMATRCWTVLRGVHQAKLKALEGLNPKSAAAVEALASHATLVRVLLEREINMAYNLGKDRALDIYYREPGSASRKHPSSAEIPAAVV